MTKTELVDAIAKSSKFKAGKYLKEAVNTGK